MNREKTLNALQLVNALKIELSETEQALVDRYINGRGVVFVGLLKRGKSTLINSLVGSSLLPTGRAPESWCSVALESDGSLIAPTSSIMGSNQTLERVVVIQQSRNGESLPEISLPESELSPKLSRSGEFHTRTDYHLRTRRVTHHVSVIGRFRLPIDLVLIDTPGVDEDFAEKVPVWKSVKARAAVLVSAFPPGIGSADRELYESLKAFFGLNVLVVLKSTDSSVGVEELKSAAQVWIKLGVQPVLLGDTRSTCTGAWSTGDLAELEKQILSLDENATESLEELAAEVDGILSSSILRHKSEVVNSATRSKAKKVLKVLDSSYELELPAATANVVSSFYVELYEQRTNFKDESTTELFQAAYRGSAKAQAEISSRWKSRLTANAAELSDFGDFGSLLELVKLSPTFSTYESRRDLECTIDDLESLERSSELTDENLDVLKFGIAKCVERTKDLSDINRLLQLPIDEMLKLSLVEEMIDTIEKQYRKGGVNTLGYLESLLTPTKWRIDMPILLNELKLGLETLLVHVKAECLEVAADTPDTRRMSDDFRHGKSERLHHILDVQTAALRLVALMADEYFDDLSQSTQQMRDLIQGDRKLVAWVNFHYPDTERLKAIRGSAESRDILFGLASLSIFVSGILGLGHWLTGSGLGGIVAYWCLVLIRRRSFPTLPMSFDEFSSGAKLNRQQRRYRLQNVAVLTCVLVLSGFGMFQTQLTRVWTAGVVTDFKSRLQVVETVPTTTVARIQKVSPQVVADGFSRYMFALGPEKSENEVRWRVEVAMPATPADERILTARLCPESTQNEAGSLQGCVTSRARGRRILDRLYYEFVFYLPKESLGGRWSPRAYLRPGVFASSRKLSIIAYPDLAVSDTASTSSTSEVTTPADDSNSTTTVDSVTPLGNLNSPFPKGLAVPVSTVEVTVLSSKWDVMNIICDSDIDNDGCDSDSSSNNFGRPSSISSVHWVQVVLKLRNTTDQPIDVSSEFSWAISVKGRLYGINDFPWGLDSIQWLDSLQAEDSQITSVYMPVPKSVGTANTLFAFSAVDDSGWIYFES